MGFEEMIVDGIVSSPIDVNFEATVTLRKIFDVFKDHTCEFFEDEFPGYCNSGGWSLVSKAYVSTYPMNKYDRLEYSEVFLAAQNFKRINFPWRKNVHGK